MLERAKETTRSGQVHLHRIRAFRRRWCATKARKGGQLWPPESSRAAQEMREGPSDSGCRSQGPNHLKLLRLNGRGGERCRKRRDKPVRCAAGKTNASEPLMTCRKRRDVIETGVQSLVRDEARGEPAYCPSGDRHKGGVSLSAGSCAERGNLPPRCQGRCSKWKTHEGQSTDARRRGGQARSSDEAR